MADPNTTPDHLGDDFYESVSPLAFDDANNDYALKTLCYALAKSFKQAETYGRSGSDLQTFTNLITNPNGQVSSSPYTSFVSSGSGVISRVDDPTSQSGSAIQNAATGLTSAGHNVLIILDQYGLPNAGMVSSGKRVLLRARVKLESATASVTSVSINRRVYDATNALIDQSLVASQASPTVGTWYELSAITTMPTNASILEMDARINAVGASGNYTIRAEHFQMVVLDSDDTDPGYFDGNTYGAVWTGTANASTSTLTVEDPEGALHPGWSILFDLDRVPYEAIPYLAQYVGQTIPAGTPEAAARNLVRSPNNQNRGTRAAITAAAQSVLTGTKSVTLVERVNNDAYKLRVITQTSESPSAQVLKNAINKVKPAGIVLEIVITSSTIIDSLVGTIDAQTATIDGL